MDQKPMDGAAAPEAPPLKDVDHTPIPSTGNSPDGWKGLVRCCLFAIAALALLSGCIFPKEGDKIVADQTKKAGVLTQEDGKALVAIGIQLEAVQDPTVQAFGKQVEALGKNVLQAGKDVELNGARLQEVLGMPEPENQKPYSKDDSEKGRQRSADEHANPWWKVAGMWVGGVLLGGGGISVLQRFFPGFFAGPLGVAAKAIMEGIARVRAVAAAREDGKVHMDEVLAELKRIQEDQGVQTVVRDYAHKIEEKVFGKKLDDEPVTAKPS